MLRTAALRGVRGCAGSQMSVAAAPAAGSRDWKSTAMMAATSPLTFTDYEKPMHYQELQFLFSENINGLVEKFFESELGPLYLNAVVLMTLMKMGVYHGFFQPSYLWHFQERYGQTWKVGHHLYGAKLPNPLKIVK